MRREPSSFRARREVSLLSMTAVGMGYADLVELHAKHGSSLVARIEIENTEVLEADVRGDCGEYVVDRVWVGHGQRRLVVGSEIDAGWRRERRSADPLGRAPPERGDRGRHELGHGPGLRIFVPADR